MDIKTETNTLSNTYRCANWLNFEPVHFSTQQRQRVLTLLSTLSKSDPTFILSRLEQANIHFSDLSLMVLEDYQNLDLLDESDSMMRLLKCLSHQYISYDEICKLPESKEYNQLILHEALKKLNELHLELLQALAKMHREMPKDFVLGEKNFASKFLVEAFAELSSTAESVQKELQFFTIKKRSVKTTNTNKSWLRLGLASSAVIIGTTLVCLLIWKPQRT